MTSAQKIPGCSHLKKDAAAHTAVAGFFLRKSLRLFVSWGFSLVTYSPNLWHLVTAKNDVLLAPSNCLQSFVGSKVCATNLAPHEFWKGNKRYVPRFKKRLMSKCSQQQHLLGNNDFSCLLKGGGEKKKTCFCYFPASSCEAPRNFRPCRPYNAPQVAEGNAGGTQL